MPHTVRLDIQGEARPVYMTTTDSTEANKLVIRVRGELRGRLKMATILPGIVTTEPTQAKP